MHGYTHQYGEQKNPYTGVSGDDYEFWNIVDNKPVAEDSVDWVVEPPGLRADGPARNGYDPVAWETPHYQGVGARSRSRRRSCSTPPTSASCTTPRTSRTSPPPTGKDFARRPDLPVPDRTRTTTASASCRRTWATSSTTSSTIDPTSNYNYTPDDIIANAKYAKAVRDGFASFFFHPVLARAGPGHAGLRGLQEDHGRHHRPRLHLGRAEQGAMSMRRCSLSSRLAHTPSQSPRTTA